MKHDHTDLPRLPAALVCALCLLSAADLAAEEGNSAFEIKLTNRAPGLLHRDEALTLEVTCTSTEAVAEATVQYVSRRLLRGDTIYEGPIGGPYKTRSPNYETRTALDRRQAVALQPMNGNVYRGELRIPLESHPYGLCYMKVSVLDAEGDALAAKDFEYAVVVDLPLVQPGNIIGFDNWGGAGNYGQLPGPTERDRYLTDYGFGWVNFKIWWNYVRADSGEFQHLESLDAWVDATLAQKARIIMNPVFQGVPDDPDDPEYILREYRKLVETFMKRYGERVVVWDVFNEADCQRWIQQDDRDVKMIRIVRELRDRHCPKTKVIISGQGTTTLNWAKSLLQRGAGEDLDGIAWHPYRNMPPDVPEADNYVGSRSGTCTLLSSVADLHEILESGGVPGDIYINEWNYALNLQPQYDDNDQANFMVRATILAWTTGYVKTLCCHAFGNGRLGPPAYPNMAAHMIDTRYVRRCNAGSADVFALVFEKSDGRVIVPAWTSTTAKTISVRGLAGRPEVRDLFGNLRDVSYDADRKTVDLLAVSQEPVYITAPMGSVPRAELSDVLHVAAPEKAETGGSVSVAVDLRRLPAGATTLVLQAAAAWNVGPASYDVDRPGRHVFEVGLPAGAETSEHPLVPGGDRDEYPLLVDLRDGAGKTLAVASTIVKAVLPAAVYRARNNIVLASDFKGEGLKGWQVQKSVQGTAEIVTEDGAPALALSKTGFDFPLVVERAVEPLEYAALEFEFMSRHEDQEFRATTGGMRLFFDVEGRLHVGATMIGAYALNEWQRMRVFLSAPDGWCRIWQNGRFLGQFAIPTAEPVVSGIRFYSRQSRAGEGTVALLREVRLVRIDPVDHAPGQPLSWTMCGPFPNHVDGATGKRPFEIGTDFLAPIGGEVNANPYPGVEVAGGAHGTCRFLPFYEVEGFPVNLITVKGLLPPDAQSSVLCYAACYLVSPDEREVPIGIGSDDSYALWINHAFVSSVNAWPLGRGSGGPDEKRTVNLQKGLNTILMKIDQGDGAYNFSLALE